MKAPLFPPCYGFAPAWPKWIAPRAHVAAREKATERKKIQQALQKVPRKTDSLDYNDGSTRNPDGRMRFNEPAPATQSGNPSRD
jgi:hypothetical protein